MRGYCAVLVLCGVALCATAEVRDLPSLDEVKAATAEKIHTDHASFVFLALFRNTARYTAVLERLTVQLTAIEAKRSLSAREQSMKALYQQTAQQTRTAFLRKHGGNGLNQTIRPSDFEANVDKIRDELADGYIQKLSPTLFRAYDRATKSAFALGMDAVNAWWRTNGDTVLDIVFFILLPLFILAWIIRSYIKNRPLSVEKLNERALAKFGDTCEERREGIKTFFTDIQNTIKFEVDVKSGGQRLRCTMERNLFTMNSPYERGLLFVCMMLGNEDGFCSPINFHHVRCALIAGRGQGQLVGDKKSIYRTEGDRLQWLLNYTGMSFDGAESTLIREVIEAHKRDSKNPVIASLKNLIFQPSSGPPPEHDEGEHDPLGPQPAKEGA